MSKMALCWIDPSSPPDSFPPIDSALDQPDGLLCFGGDLSSERLLAAYRRGIFPWYSDNQPIMWWSPHPRCVLFPEAMKISRSLKKSIRNMDLEVSMDSAFEQVIQACALPRADEAGTWITLEMQAAYIDLHEQGHAHSVEIWHQGILVGGLYGLAIGQVFFGESMFSTQRDTSKIALCALTRRLAKHSFRLIDCQVSSSHLFSLGACDVDRTEFSTLLKKYCDMTNHIKIWQHEALPVKDYCLSDE